MNASDQNFWVAFVLLGAPLIALTGGPYGWRMLVILAVLGGLTYAPLISVAVIALYLLRWPLWLFAEAVIIGLASGISARLTGVFNSPERAERQRERWLDKSRRRKTQFPVPRQRGRRPRDYFPFDDGVDHLGD